MTSASVFVSHPARAQDGAWRGRMRFDLATAGVSAVHWTRALWTGPALGERDRDGDRNADRGRDSLRTLIGRDWSRFSLLPGGPRRELFAVSRLLLKHAAALALRTEPEQLELGYSLYGRPFIRGCDEVDLSLSHSGGLLVVGVTTRGSIGVDVEPAGGRARFPAAEPHMCTPYERALIRSLPPDRRAGVLLRLWTLKEAYVKALGLGLRLPFDEFGFALDADPPLLLGPDGTPVADPAWSFRTAVLDRGHHAALALRADAGDIRAGINEPCDAAAGSSRTRAAAESGSSATF